MTNDTMMVHLRLGDVLDWPYYKQHRRCNPTHGCYYVYPMYFYERVSVPKQVLRIVIVGNPFHRFEPQFGANISLTYQSMVRTIFSKRGYRTVVQSSTPDEDFLNLVHTTHVLLGKGGFADLVRRMRVACK